MSVNCQQIIAVSKSFIPIYAFQLSNHNINPLKRVLRYCFLLLFFLPAGFSLSGTVNGVSDLSNYNFWRQGGASLNENWNLFPSVFIDPSRTDTQGKEGQINLTDLWNNTPSMGSKWSAMGFASYSLTLYMPKDHPEMGLKIPEAYTAYRLYINGKLISENGVPGKTAQSSEPKWIPKIIPLQQ